MPHGDAAPVLGLSLGPRSGAHVRCQCERRSQVGAALASNRDFFRPADGRRPSVAFGRYTGWLVGLIAAEPDLTLEEIFTAGLGLMLLLGSGRWRRDKEDGGE